MYFKWAYGKAGNGNGNRYRNGNGKLKWKLLHSGASNRLNKHVLH